MSSVCIHSFDRLFRKLLLEMSGADYEDHDRRLKVHLLNRNTNISNVIKSPINIRKCILIRI